jgi:hypothetical protein
MFSHAYSNKVTLMLLRRDGKPVTVGIRSIVVKSSRSALGAWHLHSAGRHPAAHTVSGRAREIAGNSLLQAGRRAVEKVMVPGVHARVRVLPERLAAGTRAVSHSSSVRGGAWTYYDQPAGSVPTVDA